MYTLKGRTAVTAGATGHVEAGAAYTLTEAGVNVVMVTHNTEDVRRLIAEVEHHPGTYIVPSNENGDGVAYRKVYQGFGLVDVIIPDQGVSARLKGPSDITGQELDQKLYHQITGSFTMVQKTLPYLAESRAGRVILMADTSAENGMQKEGLPGCTARDGVVSMTRYLTQVLTRQGITVNCIAKGDMENDHPVEWEGELDNKTLIPRIPAGRNGTPRDFGATVCYPASEGAGLITEQMLWLNSGMHMG